MLVLNLLYESLPLFVEGLCGWSVTGPVVVWVSGQYNGIGDSWGVEVMMIGAGEQRGWFV